MSLAVGSSDTLDASSSTPPPMQDDWSDAHDTLETDDEHELTEERRNRDEDLTIQPPKLSTTPKSHAISTPSPTVPSPTTPQHQTNGDADGGSVHSVPVVEVTEPTSPTTPMTSRSTSSIPPPSPSSSLTPTSRLPPQDRRTRHRQTLDTRASNRLSGFFSNLIHRRDHTPTTPTRESRESVTPSESTPAPNTSSRASSPLPSRPATPPPSLPPPSLTDLGLSLSTLTSYLSPSHFSSPPTSGAFLGPHYLLLCHAQGLDVVPLVSPPAVQPYTLIRRVPFKSVVVMEHRGVLVAIAGRRDGVRVYALEEVKRAIEWRMEVEVKRERERARREEMKRALTANLEAAYRRIPSDKDAKAKLFIIPSSSEDRKDKAARRSSLSIAPATVSPGIPRPPTVPKLRSPSLPAPSPTVPSGPPPAYTPSVRTWDSSIAVNPNPTRIRTTSVNDVLAGAVTRRSTSEDTEREHHNDSKGDWQTSDDEAIDPVAAPSGSQALDERTSAIATSSVATSMPSTSGTHLDVPMPNLPRTQTSTSVNSRRGRPANLDLTLTRMNTTTSTNQVAPPPSPTPTLLTLRQALLAPPANTLPNMHNLGSEPDSALPQDGEQDEEDDDVQPPSPTTPTRERISLAEALFESRLSDVPPVGTRQPQEAILLNSVASGDEEAPSSPRTSDSHANSTYTRRSTGDQSNRRRRRWSVLDGIFTPSSSALSQSSVTSVPERSLPPQSAPSISPSVRTEPTPQSRERTLSRSQSTRIHSSASAEPIRPPPPPARPSTSTGNTELRSVGTPLTGPSSNTPSIASSHSRFLPRLITNAFTSRRSEDRPATPKSADADSRRQTTTSSSGQAPAPKLEYVKLPGTKGSVTIKAVETAKKSFLAILCGDNGEKVELFAGTYRTALGLSRTFILPDSPRSLELQLQGDDLVEVFLVFSQNVFGLEPATVRVREVRIGRAERRAARRRARGNRPDQQANDNAEGDATGTPVGEEDTPVNVTIGVAVTSPTATDENPTVSTSALTTPGLSQPSEASATNPEATNATDELLTLATAQMSSYTTFQQLSFTPRFPLASIADDYIIPPTYPSFLDYRNTHEPELGGDLSQVQFSPPGLPAPTPSPPSKWFYRDPKGIVHGPWKASLMQAWYQDGLLPPELPVRREEDSEYMLLKDLRLQCIDPTHPFRLSPPPPTSPPYSLPSDASKPLLKPISLLTQPRHFGPPPLFYSSRGGHSTSIVDSRGRSVLKGRFLWSPDENDDEFLVGLPKLGDVKRLEAFDVHDRAILVAMRQGGLEVVDFGDALLKPADHSRTLFPHFHPPPSSVSRRGPFIWKIGSPISSASSTISLPSSLPSKFPSHHRQHGKKQSTGPAKSPGRSEFSLGGGDPEEHQEEVLFLGRKDDEIYICERMTGSFRLLRLSRTTSS
ncbi:hypothetical protein C8Q75DRAFT_559337 [Abortiporus biennis]|nr:hypothetical protein C8Q75DRAFT_559337 [Abortiporus biennis]